MEPERYAKQICLPHFGTLGQNRLRQSKVLLVGAGGLGCPTALYLTSMGIGCLGIAELDQVELSNLQRQILYTSEELGADKVRLATEKLQRLNGQVQIIPHPEGLTHENASSIMKNYDIIVDTSDNFPTRYLVNDTAFLLQKPLVYGGIFQWEGQVSLLDTCDNAPCYRCLYPRAPQLKNCSTFGAWAPLCGVLGSLQASETAKRILGLPTPYLGKVLCLNLLEGSFRTLRIKKDPLCQVCGGANKRAGSSTPQATQAFEITAKLCKSWLHDPRLAWLDVREAHEVAQDSLPQSLHIPLADLAHNQRKLNRKKKWVVYCQKGIRSSQAATWLLKAGFQEVYSLRGGLDAWRSSPP